MEDGRVEGGGDPASVSVHDSQVVVLLWRSFTGATVTQVRHQLAERVEAAGLTGEAGDDFVLAVHELVTNAVRHGGGAGQMNLHLRADVLVCDVTDHGVGTGEPLVGLPGVDVPGGRGLWLAQRLTGSLVLTRAPSGVTASVSACLTPTTAALDRSPPDTDRVDVSVDEG